VTYVFIFFIGHLTLWSIKNIDVAHIYFYRLMQHLQPTTFDVKQWRNQPGEYQLVRPNSKQNTLTKIKFYYTVDVVLIADYCNYVE